ncbi:MAG: EamA family transporter [Actinomycetaceae bacterium]|nr:EamA family transporter [Actinomycetaceae bacterium]
MRRPSKRAVAPALFIASGTTQYVGAALAVVLFASLAPTTVAWWRVTISALVLLAWRRPWRQGLTAREVGTSALFGVIMSGMNITFYESIARLDLGVAVSLEFMGPVAVAVALGRGWVSKLAGVVALAGVVLISGFGLDVSSPTVAAGIFWAFLAGSLWAAYIVLGRRIASSRSGLTSLSIASVTGSVVYFPLVARDFLGAFQSSELFWTVLGVAFLSTVIPYSIDQINMSWIDAPTFALLNALLPATSLLVGAVGLRQLPEPVSIVGLVLVSVAVWMASRPAPPRKLIRE